MPITSENVRAIAAWEQAEGTKASFNPLATTQSGFAGETKFNSVGVKNYATYQDGIDANAHALLNGRYTNILDALRAPGKPVLLIFVDPGCGPCTALLPEIGRWQRDLREARQGGDVPVGQLVPLQPRDPRDEGKVVGVVALLVAAFPEAAGVALLHWLGHRER